MDYLRRKIVASSTFPEYLNKNTCKFRRTLTRKHKQRINQTFVGKIGNFFTFLKTDCCNRSNRSSVARFPENPGRKGKSRTRMRIIAGSERKKINNNNNRGKSERTVRIEQCVWLGVAVCGIYDATDLLCRR